MKNAANPRADNTFGHIVEMTPPNGDHAAQSYEWDILVMCRDPSDPDHKAKWGLRLCE